MLFAQVSTPNSITFTVPEIALIITIVTFIFGLIAYYVKSELFQSIQKKIDEGKDGSSQNRKEIYSRIESLEKEFSQSIARLDRDSSLLQLRQTSFSENMEKVEESLEKMNNKMETMSHNMTEQIGAQNQILKEILAKVTPK